MAQETIDIGTTPNDGTGDALRTAFGKVNDNFTELYAAVAAATPLSAPQGRLTLTSGAPVITSVTGASTVYYTPYAGDRCPLYDGTKFSPANFSELSQTLSDSTKSPAAAASNSVYDLFVWSDSGAVRCTRGPAWTNSTTRSAGTALVRVGGLLLNSAAITNGPAASRGTYVGTIATNASGTVDFVIATAGAASWLGVWNCYNRINLACAGSDSSFWTYTSSTIRAANNGSKARVTFVSGLAEDAIPCSYQSRIDLASVSSALAFIGFKLDATNAFDTRSVLVNNAASQMTGGLACNLTYPPQLGLHYVQATEAGDNTNASTFYGATYSFLNVGLRG